MKNLWLHGVYLTVIGVLGFQLWAKTAWVDLAFQQIDRLIERNCQVLHGDSQILFEEIKKMIPTNPKVYGFLLKDTENIDTCSRRVNEALDMQLADLKIGEKANLNRTKNTLQTFSNSLFLGLNELDKMALIKNSLVIKRIKNDTFWTHFNENPATNLWVIKNEVKLDELMMCNYCTDKIGCNRGYNYFRSKLRVLISPRNSIMVEGEQFQADIFLNHYTQYANPIIKFYANNQEVTVKDGVGRYSNVENSVGLKKIFVNAIIKNPENGEEINAYSAFEYHVLPKCSQNCQ